MYLVFVLHFASICSHAVNEFPTFWKTNEIVIFNYSLVVCCERKTPVYSFVFIVFVWDMSPNSE